MAEDLASDKAIAELREKLENPVHEHKWKYDETVKHDGAEFNCYHLVCEGYSRGKKCQANLGINMQTQERHYEERS